jgi:heat shock protein HtpX
MQNTKTENFTKYSGGNVVKTWIYIILFTLLIGLIGSLLASYFQQPLFFYLGTAVSIGMAVWSYWFSDKTVLKMANAKPLEQGDNMELQRMVAQLASSAGLPTPKIYIVEDPSPNAFATGRNPENGVIAFTTGILSLLNKDELAGVAAHELAHIANRDTLLMTVVAVFANILQSVIHYMYFFRGNNHEGGSSNNALVGVAVSVAIMILAPLAATIIQMAVSRNREFLADATGVQISGYPKGLAEALQKIHNFPQGLQSVNPSISHMYISNPEKETETHHTPWYMKLFMTHPPVQERIAALLKI